MAELTIRAALPSDLADILDLYPKAFPDEDLVPLVHELLEGEVDLLSLVATRGEAIVGHVIFTACKVEETGEPIALLGPLCVSPDCQRQGIGSRLIADGVAELTRREVREVLVLGDPAYYSRAGFKPRAALKTPCPIPAEWADAWQTMPLQPGSQPLTGQLWVPGPWQAKALWSA